MQPSQLRLRMELWIQMGSRQCVTKEGSDVQGYTGNVVAWMVLGTPQANDHLKPLDLLKTHAYLEFFVILALFVGVFAKMTIFPVYLQKWHDSGENRTVAVRFYLFRTATVRFHIHRMTVVRFHVSTAWSPCGSHLPICNCLITITHNIKCLLDELR